KFGEKQADEVERVRSHGVTRKLGALPGCQMNIELALQLRHFSAQLLEGLVVGEPGRQPPQFIDVLFKPLDLLFALALRISSLQSLLAPLPPPQVHSITSTASAPQTAATAANRSSPAWTRCCTCSSATAPSRERNSKHTEHPPGFPQKRSCNWSKTSSL